MTKLVFGVNDVPYSGQNGTTTGDVAEILEARYRIMQFFYEEHQDEIVGELEEVMQGKLDNVLMGAQAPPALFAEGDLSGVEEAFRRFLDNREMDGRVPGVPTKAAMKGINHRLTHPYARSNPERPSFIDTGAYQNNFVARVEE